MGARTIQMCQRDGSRFTAFSGIRKMATTHTRRSWAIFEAMGANHYESGLVLMPSNRYQDKAITQKKQQPATTKTKSPTRHRAGPYPKSSAPGAQSFFSG